MARNSYRSPGDATRIASMTVHGIVAFTDGGITIASIPGVEKFHDLGEHFAKQRLVARLAGLGDIQSIRWMKHDAHFLPSHPGGISFAIITGIDDDVTIIKTFLSHVRDQFLSDFDGIGDDIFEACQRCTARLEKIVNDAIASYNAEHLDCMRLASRDAGSMSGISTFKSPSRDVY